MALPPCAVRRTSSSSVQMLTAIMRSPSSSFIAILPLALTLTKSESSLRRTLPERVANMTLSAPQLASSSGSGMTVVMVSPGESGSRLTIALPRPCGVDCGRRQTFSL